MSLTVFYSWQKSLPNSTNRSFIETALDKAIKGIKSENKLAKDLTIDRDTKNIPGSPNIAQTILDKITNALVFIGDVSIINNEYPSKLTPNPNVLLELGYAIHCHTWDRIICIANTAYSRVEDLPFDIRQHRILTYTVRENEKNKAAQRNLLSSQLQEALQAIVNTHEQKNQKSAKVKLIDCRLGPVPHQNNSKMSDWQFNGQIYIAARNAAGRITVPIYSMEIWLELPNIITPTKFKLRRISKGQEGFGNPIIDVSGSCICSIDASGAITPTIPNELRRNAIITIKLETDDSDHIQSYAFDVPYVTDLGRWLISK